MSTLTSTHFDLPAGLLEELHARYRSPPRAYHSWSHIEAMLCHFDDVARGPGWHRPLEVLLAVLFHDVVYAAGRKDNEAQSAEVAREMIASRLAGRSVDVNRVAELINLTAQYGRLEGSQLDHDSAHFVDCDMAILGAPLASFDVYNLGVAEEYAPHVNATLYRFGRRRFLAKLLDAKRIFFTEFSHSKLDEPARANLRRALGR